MTIMYWLYGLLAWQLWVFVYAKELPGLNYVSSGFDAAKMVSINEISPSDQSKFRLFDFDESDDKTYTLTIGNQKQDFIVPSLAQVNDISMITVQTVESISKSYVEFISRYYSSSSFELNIIFPIKYIPVTLKLGVDKTVKEAHKMMQSAYTAAAISTMWWGMYSIQAAPGYMLKFSSLFNKTLSKLVSNPATEREQSFYNEIVATFGTHYVSSVIVGAIAQSYTFLTDEWQRTSSESSTENQVSIGFHLGFDIPLGNGVSIGFGDEFGGIKIGGSWGNTAGVQSEMFKKNSVTKSLMRPPPPPLESSSSTDNHRWAAWASQAAKQPVVVNQTLFPLSNLLVEYPTGIAEHLQKTINFYLMNGKLPKLTDLLQRQKLSTDSSMSIPGLDVVGCGYDIINLVSKQCIFEIIHNNKNLWSNVFNGRRSYRIPDGYSVKGAREFISTYDTQIFNSYDKFIQNSIYMNQQDQAKLLGFGASHERTEIATRLRNIYKHHLNLAWTKRKVHWYNLSMVTSSPPSLNSAAKTALNSLPLIFNEEDFSKIWKDFFDTYGTHYVASAGFGGMVWVEDYFDPCLIIKYSSQWIKDQIRRSYWFISTSEFNSLYVPTTNQDYLKYRISTMQVIGGQENLTSFQLNKWMQTIKDRPHALSYRLQPLYTLLPLQSQRRKALEEATLYVRLQAVNTTNEYINNYQTQQAIKWRECLYLKFRK